MRVIRYYVFMQTLPIKKYLHSWTHACRGYGRNIDDHVSADPVSWIELFVLFNSRTLRHVTIFLDIHSSYST